MQPCTIVKIPPRFRMLKAISFSGFALNTSEQSAATEYSAATGSTTTSTGDGHRVEHVALRIFYWISSKIVLKISKNLPMPTVLKMLLFLMTSFSPWIHVTKAIGKVYEFMICESGFKRSDFNHGGKMRS